jgi:hypothetical protein
MVILVVRGGNVTTKSNITTRYHRVLRVGS